MTYVREIEEDGTLWCPATAGRCNQSDCSDCDNAVEVCSWGTLCECPDPEVM